MTRGGEAESTDLAGAPEIEVTPAMIDAGVRKLYANMTDDPNPADAREAVRDIFTAMVRSSCP